MSLLLLKLRLLVALLPLLPLALLPAAACGRPSLALLQGHLQQGRHLWRHSPQLVPAVCISAAVSKGTSRLFAPPVGEGQTGAR